MPSSARSPTAYRFPMIFRILLIDDHEIMLQGLDLLLRDQPGLQVVGQASDCAAAWRAVADLAPDLVVMDLNLPGEGGASLAARIRAQFPGTKIVVLTGHAEGRYLEAALAAGADGFVSKADGCANLLQALRTVLAGKAYLCPEASTLLVHAFNGRQDRRSGGPPVLSPREIQVLKEIADGRSTKAIAFNLKISAKTVESHRKNLLTKVGVDSVAELTKFAVREGLTTL